MRISLSGQADPHVHLGVSCGEHNEGFRPKNPSEQHSTWLKVHPGTSYQLSKRTPHQIRVESFF
jgi:hypothetical protein